MCQYFSRSRLPYTQVSFDTHAYLSAFRGVQGGCFSIKLLDPLSVYPGGVRNGVESLSLNLSSTARSSSQSGGRVRGARDAAVKAAFSYQIVAPYAPCPAGVPMPISKRRGERQTGTQWGGDEI